MAGDTAINMTPTSILEGTKKAKNNRTAGKDDIPAELIKAGGDVYAVKLADLGRKVLENEVWRANS